MESKLDNKIGIYRNSSSMKVAKFLNIKNNRLIILDTCVNYSISASNLEFEKSQFILLDIIKKETKKLYDKSDATTKNIVDKALEKNTCKSNADYLIKEVKKILNYSTGTRSLPDITDIILALSPACNDSDAVVATLNTHVIAMTDYFNNDWFYILHKDQENKFQNLKLNFIPKLRKQIADFQNTNKVILNKLYEILRNNRKK